MNTPAPRIEILNKKKLVGKHIRMSLANNRTFELWHSFMPKRKEILNTVSPNLFSVRVYDGIPDFSDLNEEFEKWAAMEVNDKAAIPQGMEPFELKGGLYAVFHYKGLNTDFSIYEYIYGQWLINSPYKLDDRPHFEIMGEKYRNNDPESEEEIWIPINNK